MSVSYHAVPRRDPQLVRDALEGRSAGTPIDVDAVRTALRKLGFDDAESTTLEWEGDGSYVAVDVFTHHVDVTHGTRGGDAVLAKVGAALDVLGAHGLHVWDPQQDDWFPLA